MQKTSTTLLFFLVLITFQLNAQTQIKYLSGTGSDQTVDWQFYCTDGHNSGKWTTIPVPSCWELQGFGSYNYGHVPFEERLKEKGLYKYEFEASRHWRFKDVRLVFEGVMTDAEVKINGISAGPVHQGAFYEFSYDVSKLLRYDSLNLLEVTVSKHSGNESVNQAERKADYWIFGGIFRPVYIEVKPINHIKRVAIDARQDGSLTTDVFYHSPMARFVEVTVQEINKNFDTIAQQTFPLDPAREDIRLSLKVDSVQTWTPESPNLYLVRYFLFDDQHRLLHQHRERIGFRTVEVRAGDGIYVNGVRIKFKGVNRHSFWPTTGRTLNKKQSIEDVKMMKDMNMNAVRMSHYPPDKHFLDVCDELGLFVLDELAGWQRPAYDAEIGRKLLQEMVIRDVNHPSIILWDNGNEGGWNRELDSEFAKWDIQQREVIHPWEVFGKTNTFHYGQYDALVHDGHQQDKIYFPTEFLHGLYDGGHGAGLDDFWKYMWHDPLSAGGFLWVFADEGVVRTDRNGEIDTDGNHAPDGIVGPFHEKEGSYYTIKEIWSPIQLEKRFITPDFNGVFRVENRYHYTNFNQCQIYLRWLKMVSPSVNGNIDSVAQDFLKGTDIPPQQSGFLSIPMPEDWQDYDVLWLEIRDSQGSLFNWSFPLKSPDILNEKILSKKQSAATIIAQETTNTIALEYGSMQLKFDTRTGYLEEVQRDGQALPISKGPMILSEKEDEPETVSHKKIANGYEITAVYKSGNTFRWILQNNGLLDLEATFKNQRTIEGYEGITFGLEEKEIASKMWLGDGPYRVYRNRMKGTQFFTWSNDYNNTITGESEYEYPEFKGFFSNLYWVQIKTKNSGAFTIHNHTPFTFLRMLTPDQPSDPRSGATVKDYPPGDLSFLKTIAPIGTKFAPAETLGPQSLPQTVIGREIEPMRIHLTFDFIGGD